MLSAFVNCLKIPELRQRIFFTLTLLFIARVGANIPLPGLDPLPLKDFFAEQASAASGTLVGIYNMFTGGALQNGAIFALGIMPYISASIIMQLMGAVFPFIARLQQEGDIGRQKINQYTRYLTIFICAVQAILLVTALMKNPGTLIPGFSTEAYGAIIPNQNFWFLVTSVIFLTTGCTLLMWMGEQITQNGIGNGISLIIMVGIISDLPSAVAAAYTHFFDRPADLAQGVMSPVTQGILMLVMLFVVVAGIVAVTQAQRKIPVQYAKRVVGRKMYGGQSSFLPLKINYSGVMPVIFASAILMFPYQFFQYLGSAFEMSFFLDLSSAIERGEWLYYVVYGSLILVFSYFWVSLMFKPSQIADELKKNGGYVPGVRPGSPTAKFLDFVMTRLTLAGAMFLTLIAVMPDLLFSLYQIPYKIAMFFGGTGMLITVGVLLDTMRQIETQLLQRHYDGFLKKGKSRNRKSGRSQQMIENVGIQEFWVVWKGLIVIASVLFVLGIVASFLNN